MANTLTPTTERAAALTVPTFTGTLAGIEQTLVNARALHTALGAGRDFSTWFKDRAEQHLLIEGEDYSPVSGNRSDDLPGKPRTDYHLSLDTAKHLALAERTPAGRAVRQYFIEVERAAREQAAPTLAALREQNQLLRTQLAQHAHDYLERHPKARQLLKYHAIEGLTHQEKARLMGWKTGESWRSALKELAALGLVAYEPNEARQTAGRASIARLQAYSRNQVLSPARQAALAANLAKARAAQAQKRAASAATPAACAQQGGAQ